MELALNSREELREKFGLEEYFVFSAMLLVSALIGIYFWLQSRRKSEEEGNVEFLLGGKSMGVLPMTFSLVASFMSAITLLGTPAETYVNGTQYCVLALTYPFVMWLTAKLFLPVFHNLNVATSYEYLEWRFNKTVRMIASIAFSLHMILYMAIVVYTPALALSQITGMNVDLACLIIYVVCIFYTTLGGIKAVMWTDTFQSAVMFGSFIAIILKGNYNAGGWSEVFDQNYQTSRIELFNFNPNPLERHTVWSVIIGGLFTWLGIYAVNQTMVQRYLSVDSVKKATKALYFNAVGVASLLVICAYAGLVIFAYYYKAGCDPIRSKQVTKKDQLFPLFVMQVMGDIPLIPGLFVAGVFSGALSTVSSGLNSLSAVAFQDLIKSGYNIHLSDNASNILTKVLAFVFGIISFLVVFLVKFLPGVLEAALAVHGIVGGPLLGVFFLGMMVPFANSRGATAGTIASFVIISWIGFGQTISRKLGHFPSTGLNTTIENCPEYFFNTTLPEETKFDFWFPYLPVYKLSYMWFSMLSFLICLVVGIVVSLIFEPTDPTKVNPDLISPLFKEWAAMLPESLQERLQADKVGSQFVWTEKERCLRDNQLTSDHTELDPHDRHGRNLETHTNFAMQLDEIRPK